MYVPCASDIRTCSLYLLCAACDVCVRLMKQRRQHICLYGHMATNKIIYMLRHVCLCHHQSSVLYAQETVTPANLIARLQHYFPQFIERKNTNSLPATTSLVMSCANGTLERSEDQSRLYDWQKLYLVRCQPYITPSSTINAFPMNELTLPSLISTPIVQGISRFEWVTPAVYELLYDPPNNNTNNKEPCPHNVRQGSRSHRKTRTRKSRKCYPTSQFVHVGQLVAIPALPQPSMNVHAIHSYTDTPYSSSSSRVYSGVPMRVCGTVISLQDYVHFLSTTPAVEQTQKTNGSEGESITDKQLATDAADATTLPTNGLAPLTNISSASLFAPPTAHAHRATPRSSRCLRQRCSNTEYEGQEEEEAKALLNENDTPYVASRTMHWECLPLSDYLQAIAHNTASTRTYKSTQNSTLQTTYKTDVQGSSNNGKQPSVCLTEWLQAHSVGILRLTEHEVCYCSLIVQPHSTCEGNTTGNDNATSGQACSTHTSPSYMTACHYAYLVEPTTIDLASWLKRNGQIPCTSAQYSSAATDITSSRSSISTGTTKQPPFLPSHTLLLDAKAEALLTIAAYCRSKCKRDTLHPMKSESRIEQEGLYPLPTPQALFHSAYMSFSSKTLAGSIRFSTTHAHSLLESYLNKTRGTTTSEGSVCMGQPCMSLLPSRTALLQNSGWSPHITTFTEQLRYGTLIVYD